MAPNREHRSSIKSFHDTEQSFALFLNPDAVQDIELGTKTTISAVQLYDRNRSMRISVCSLVMWPLMLVSFDQTLLKKQARDCKPSSDRYVF